MRLNYFCNVTEGLSTGFTPLTGSALLQDTGYAQVVFTWTRPFTNSATELATSASCTFTLPGAVGGQQFIVRFNGATLRDYSVSFNGQAINNPVTTGAQISGTIGVHRFSVSPPRPLNGPSIRWSCSMSPNNGTPAPTITYLGSSSNAGLASPFLGTMRIDQGEVPFAVTIGSCRFGIVDNGPGYSAVMSLAVPDPCTPAATPALAQCNNVGVPSRLTLTLRNRNNQAGASGSVTLTGGASGTCVGPGSCVYTPTSGSTVPVTVAPAPAPGWKVASYSGDCVPGGVAFAQANDNMLRPRCYPPDPIELDAIKTCVVTFDRLAAGETPGC
jgi:hypothetical protein